MLSDADLVAYRDDLAAAAATGRSAGGLTSESVGLLQGAADTAAEIEAELSLRRTGEQQLEAAADAALASLGISASHRRTRPALVRTLTVPARQRPRPAYGRSERSMIRVASGSPDGSARFGDDIEIGAALLEAAENARRGKGVDGERIPVASIHWEGAYESQVAVRENASGSDNGLALQHAAEDHIARMRTYGEMRVASGGVVGPPEPRYQVPTWGVATRPIRDALPSVLSSRGELVFNRAPLLEAVLADTASGAIGTVTSAQDISVATKNLQEIPAPTPTTVTVEAETLRTSQGNFSDRFNPEWTRSWMANAQVRFARHNETLRFADIAAASTHFVDTPADFGAWRDLKRCLLGMIAELKDRLRDPNLPIRCLMPEYVPAMCACDLTAQAPGDDAWGVTADDVRARLNALDSSTTFTYVFDGNAPNQRLLSTPAVLGGGASSRSAGFDTDVDFLVFPEGAWAFLDGGSLDLGIVRDSIVSATNKFQTFAEVWEAVAPLGPVSYHTTISLCADGSSQAADAIDVCSPQGS